MQPIADYGLVGDTRTAALVSSDGSVDWLCVPRFDSAPIFGRLVGGPAAGRFRLGPAATPTVVARIYRHHTATLETTWVTPGGKLTLTEAMVAEVGGRLLPATVLVRRLSAEGGSVDAVVEFDPRCGEQHREPRIRHRGRHWRRGDGCGLNQGRWFHHGGRNGFRGLNWLCRGRKSRRFGFLADKDQRLRHRSRLGLFNRFRRSNPGNLRRGHQRNVHRPRSKR